MHIAGTPPAPCDNKDCSNADGCTLDAAGDAVCFCLQGYRLVASDASCISKLHTYHDLFPYVIYLNLMLTVYYNDMSTIVKQNEHVSFL